jgi:DNA-3-methyladenine glycosylase II
LLSIFKYGAREIRHLKARDEKLGAAIDAIGKIRRAGERDLFAALVNCIVGQQISTKAHETIWLRMQNALGEITPQTILACPQDSLQRCGISFKKAAYIHGAAQSAADGSLPLAALPSMPDADVCAALVKLKGVGTWTAEMLLLFSMQRPDILSYGDFAIQRGMRMLYHHRKITRPLFEKYRKRYSPYGSVASLYLWAIAGGAIAGMRDYGAE